MPVVQAIAAFVLVFLLPGFAWTLVFFKKITILERAAFSFGLSIVVVTLAVLALNVLLHVKITGTNALITIIVMTVIPVVIYLVKKYLRHKSEASYGE
jgi:uncharacterized membrane protein